MAIIKETILVGELRKILTEKKEHKRYEHTDVDDLAVKIAAQLKEFKRAVSQHIDDQETMRAINKVYNFCLRVTPFSEYKKAVHRKKKMEEDIKISGKADGNSFEKAVDAAAKGKMDVIVEKK